MNPAASLSLMAAAVELVLGVLALGFARAPGYGHLRWFAAIAFSASAFSLVNLCFVLSVAPPVVFWAARANAFVGAIHCMVWIVYAAARQGERPTRVERAFMAALGVGGVLSLIPGVVSSDVLQHQRVPWLGLTYHVPQTHPATAILFFTMWASLALPLSRYLRALKTGQAGAGLQVVAFGFYYLTALDEVLVGLGVIRMPYLGDLGILAILLATSGDLMRRVVEDATRLTGWNRELEAEVERRMNELEKARSALREAERHAALGRLAAAVGHEINNPLTYVIANVELARSHIEAKANGAIVEALDEALDGTSRIRRIVDDLKMFSRTKDGSQTGPVDLRDTLQGALRLVAHDLRHRARLSFDCAANLPFVVGDAARLGQVFMNLLVNAGQAMDPDEPDDNRITVRAFRDDEWVIVEIADTGEGIAEHVLPRIFEPYFTTRAGRGGTGLGLSISREIVTSLGGTLDVESKAGRGTTVRVRLVATRDVARREGRPEPRAEPTTRRRVLVVDDDILVARALRRMLKEHEVDVADGGHEALERLRTGAHYDVVLCDLMMPDCSGMEVWEKARKTGLEAAERFVFMTGGAVTDDARAFLATEDRRWVEKPLERGVLLDAIERVASCPR